jgi:hypothetical protein
MRKITPHGLIVDKIDDKDFKLGQLKLAAEVLQPNQDWTEFLPVKEYQNKNGLETYSCVTFGTLNCLEILHKRLFGSEENYSERFCSTLSGTTQEGNSIQKVVETIRKVCGVIPEVFLPFDNTINTWEEFFAPIPQTLIDMGKEWLTQFSVGHEWVFTKGDGKDRVRRLKECLQYSPIGVSVMAWDRNDEGLYIKEKGEGDNHWVCLYGFLEGQYWKIYDSYDHDTKELAWDYDFGYGKRFTLTKKVLTPVEVSIIKISIMQRIIAIMKQIIELKNQLGKKIAGFFKGRS